MTTYDKEHNLCKKVGKVTEQKDDCNLQQPQRINCEDRGESDFHSYHIIILNFQLSAEN